MFEFPCPHCRIPLRIRDYAYRNREIPCPECREQILIIETNGELIGVPVVETKVKGAEADHSHDVSHDVLSGFQPPQASLKLVWGLVGVVFGAIALIAFFWQPQRMVHEQNVGQADLIENANQADSVVATDGGADGGILDKQTPFVVDQDSATDESTAVGSMNQAETPTTPVTQTTQTQSLLEAKYQGLGEYVFARQAASPEFPANLHNEEIQKWSFLTAYAEQRLGPGVSRNAQDLWNAPINDEFVRRSFPDVLNPALPVGAGEDGYPPTHFVGISGFQSEPGFFSVTERKRAEKNSKGAGQTMMMAGVTQQLGSWSRPGQATVRAFQSAPFVNGPDGFGTGQTKLMAVLMADGSVREISAEIDPVVLKQLVSVRSPEEQMKPVQDSSESPALSESAVPPIPAELLESRLQQSIAAFEVQSPTTIRRLLPDLQELVGFQFDVSRLSEAALNREVTAKLKETNVDEILRTLLNSAQLTLRIEGTGLVIEEN